MQTRLDTRRSCMLYSVGSRHLRIRGTTYSSGITGDDTTEQLVMATKKQRHGAYPSCVYHHEPEVPPPSAPSSPTGQGTIVSSGHVAPPWSLSVQFGTGQRAIRLFRLPCRTCCCVGLPSQPDTCNLTSPVASVECFCCPFMTLQNSIFLWPT
jgi:hypothetical protein